MNAYREPNYMIDGISQKIVCHLQTGEGAKQTCDAHYHGYIELLYCLSGTFSVWLNNKYYGFHTGDLLVVNSNEVHAVQSVSEGINSYIVLRFEPEILYDSTQNIFEVKYVLPFMLNNAMPQKVFTYNEIYSTDIPRLMHDSLDEYLNGEYGFELAIRSNICRIFVWILRHWKRIGIQLPASASSDSEHIKGLQKVLDYMSLNYSESISAYHMAELMNLSYSYFSRIFKRLMNKSFNEYLNYIRVTEAEKLLIASSMNITHIAYEVGFASSSYFIKIFSRYKSVSPAQFRKNYNKYH